MAKTCMCIPGGVCSSRRSFRTEVAAAKDRPTDAWSKSWERQSEDEQRHEQRHEEQRRSSPTGRDFGHQELCNDGNAPHSRFTTQRAASRPACPGCFPVPLTRHALHPFYCLGFIPRLQDGQAATNLLRADDSRRLPTVPRVGWTQTYAICVCGPPFVCGASVHAVVFEMFLRASRLCRQKKSASLTTGHPLLQLYRVSSSTSHSSVRLPNDDGLFTHGRMQRRIKRSADWRRRVG